MNDISFQIVEPNNHQLIRLIASWYLQEWNIDPAITIKKVSSFDSNGIPFQVIMTGNNMPIATGGIHNHVGLHDIEPRFKVFSPWLALVFTTVENRNKGYGALLCKKIQSLVKQKGGKEIFLFTHTAESLYKRLGWQQLERINLKGKEIVIMRKKL